MLFFALSLPGSSSLALGAHVRDHGRHGPVGSATALSLLRRGEPVAILTRNPPAADHWRARGAEVLFADAEMSSLRDALQRDDVLCW